MRLFYYLFHCFVLLLPPPSSFLVLTTYGFCPFLALNVVTAIIDSGSLCLGHSFPVTEHPPPHTTQHADRPLLSLGITRNALIVTVNSGGYTIPGQVWCPSLLSSLDPQAWRSTMKPTLRGQTSKGVGPKQT